jgi:sugar/nucleoside kinase (ribokinase family)
MRRYDVCAIGNALVDYEIDVEDTFFSRNEIEKGMMTLVDEDRQKNLLRQVSNNIKKKQGGGSAANSVVALNQLGGKGYYSCKVADDEDGQFYLKDLHELGIDTSLDGKELPQGVTGKCLIMVTPDAERTMNTCLAITSDFSPQELNETAILSSQYLFIEGYLVSSPTGFDAALKAKQLAESKNVKVALTFSDPSMVKYFGENMTQLVGASVDLVFCNEEEAMLYTKTKTVEAASEQLKHAAKHFVITQGQNGAIIWDGEAFIDVEPHPINALDTTGAGDMFAGAFLYAITNGYDMASAGLLASKTSSTVVGQYGPRLQQSEMHLIKKGLLSS